MENLTRRLRKLERDYHEMREQVVTAKAGWCAVMRMVKDNGVERRLHRRELAYLSGDELRSMSDKALGALRLAVADNEHLRDVLRMSEDAQSAKSSSSSRFTSICVNVFARILSVPTIRLKPSNRWRLS